MMIDENKVFVTWEEVIVDFFRVKKEAEEDKYLKEVIKKVVEIYKSENYLNNEKIEAILDGKKHISQTSLEFQREKFTHILGVTEVSSELEQAELHNDYQVKLGGILDKYDPVKWITMAAKNASSVSFATHVIKLTHSKIDSSSIYDQIDSVKTDTLTTSNLLEKNIDGAVSGNQFAPIFQFLELELDGNKLAAEFTADLPCPLKPFAANDEGLKVWNDGFKKALSNERLSTHLLAKQVYFPVDSKGFSYHLLCTVKSSSLAHTIFESVSDKNQKEINLLRNKAKYSIIATTSYPQKARISVTASNHSNASQLNGKRGGKLSLLSAQPPTWTNQCKPPVYKKSMFDERFFYQNIKEDIDYLRDFLLRFERIDLSIKKPERKKWIDRWLANIIDEFLFFVGSVQNLPSGWSVAEDIKLKPAHQYLLDPYRRDDAFQSARNTADWQAVVCKDFSHWLNRRLIGKDKQFTPQPEHRRMWESLLEKTLRDHSEMLDIELKFQVEATV
jgi:CRISPR-associated protein Csy1